MLVCFDGEHRVIVLDSGLRNTAVQGAWGVVRRGVVFRNAEGVCARQGDGDRPVLLAL